MRYIKVLLLAVVFFLALVFFFQNQGPLSKDMVLTLHLFFIPPMHSIPLPFYFLVIVAFALGSLLTLSFLVWDKLNLSARLMKHKWHISNLERENAKLKKKSETETTKFSFLHRNKENTDGAQSVATKPVAIAEESLVPDPDKH
ncbi:MAG: LapA family protein [Desulfovibrio sp.]|nr:LapA family protein [Desulfovibrio sp.]